MCILLNRLTSELERQGCLVAGPTEKIRRYLGVFYSCERVAMGAEILEVDGAPVNGAVTVTAAATSAIPSVYEKRNA